jgi:hypothetical protein
MPRIRHELRSAPSNITSRRLPLVTPVGSLLQNKRLTASDAIHRKKVINPMRAGRDDAVTAKRPMALGNMLRTWARHYALVAKHAPPNGTNTQNLGLGRLPIEGVVEVNSPDTLGRVPAAGHSECDEPRKAPGHTRYKADR